MAYIYRRKTNLVDMLIEDHFWLKVSVADGIGSTGDYTLILGDLTFVETDPASGADDSGTLATGLKDQINAASEPITAFDGAATGEILIRYDKYNQSPAGITNQNFEYEASTTDDDGEISVKEILPASYKFKNAANWDGTFTDMETISFVKGKRSTRFRPSEMLVANQVSANQLRGRTRFLFDPADYALVDEDVLFYKLSTVVDGVEIEDGPIQILLTSQQLIQPRAVLLLNGNTPQGASYDDRLEIQLPRYIVDMTIKNTGTTNDLKVSFGAGSAELTVSPSSSFGDNRLNVSQLDMRAVGGTTATEVYMVLATNSSL
jgi:hypothetical protein